MAQSTELEKLAADFPFEGNLCARVHTLDDLYVLDESSVCHIIMDFTPGEEDIMVWANAAYLEATEKTMEEFTSLKASDLSSSMRKLNHHYYEQTQVKRQPDRYAHTMYPKKGPWKLYFITRPFRLLRDSEERIVIFVDLIPVRDQMLNSSFRPLEELIRYTNVLQLMIDCKSFEVVTGNPCAQCSYGCTKDFMLLKEQRRLHLNDIVDSCCWDSEEQKQEAWERVSNLTLQSDPVEMEVRKGSATGMPEDESSFVWHKIVWVPAVNPATGLESLMVSEYDISELKKTQEHLVVASEMQDTTFASISHELRTPLNGIVGLTDALLCGPTGAGKDKMLQVIKAQAMRLGCLVDDILDAAISRRSKLVIKHETCDLFATADVVCELLRPLIHRKVALVNAIPDDLPPITADLNRITQILTNLVSNAIKFTDKGSITLRAREAGTGRVAIEVVDTGRGIASNRLDGIWGAFEQESSSTARMFGGAGLGLSLVRPHPAAVGAQCTARVLSGREAGRVGWEAWEGGGGLTVCLPGESLRWCMVLQVKSLAEAHGGSCSVASTFGGAGSGTTFTVVLPTTQDGRDRGEAEDDGRQEGREEPAKRATDRGVMRCKMQAKERGPEEMARREAALVRREEAVAARERAVELRELDLEASAGPGRAAEGGGGRHVAAWPGDDEPRECVLELRARVQELEEQARQLQQELRRAEDDMQRLASSSQQATPRPDASSWAGSVPANGAQSSSFNGRSLDRRSRGQQEQEEASGGDDAGYGPYGKAVFLRIMQNARSGGGGKRADGASGKGQSPLRGVISARGRRKDRDSSESS